MTGWPGIDAAGWRAAVAGDALLARHARHVAIRFAFDCDGEAVEFAFGDAPASTAFTLAAPASIWARVLQWLPPRHHHSLFALRMRVPDFRILGEELAFMQHCHLARRVLEIGRWVAAGKPGPVPPSLRPTLAEPTPAAIAGRYLPVTADGTAYRIHAEQAGEGLDLLCLHTAGADGRQFHRLMADRAITDHWRLTAFDLPWHGKSPPPPGATPGDWTLTTDRYVQLIMGVIAAAGLRRPVVLGASMSGEICLELALRHPDSFRGIVACEASDHIDGRKTPWADHSQVNQAIFVPEWIEGLMAPHSPASCATDVWWGYSQGGHATFARDIDFYSGEWDARDRIHRIDTARCPLFMLTGEYDYSCTVEHSAATAARIPGAQFAMMPGIGHFPFAENPPLFARHLRPILDRLSARP
ncbi:MAG: alpha/beta fold hydrolase [Paracraurococcus sp.]